MPPPRCRARVVSALVIRGGGCPLRVCPGETRPTVPPLSGREHPDLPLCPELRIACCSEVHPERDFRAPRDGRGRGGLLGFSQRLPPGTLSLHTHPPACEQPGRNSLPQTKQAPPPYSPPIPSPDLIIDYLLSRLLFPEGVIGGHRGDERWAPGPANKVGGSSDEHPVCGVGAAGESVWQKKH